MVEVSTIWNISDELTIGTFNNGINRLYYCVNCIMILRQFDIVLNHAKCDKWTNRVVGNHDIFWSNWTVGLNGFYNLLDTSITISTTLGNDDTVLVERKILFNQVLSMRDPISMNSNYNFFNTWFQDEFFNCVDQNRTITQLQELFW